MTKAKIVSEVKVKDEPKEVLHKDGEPTVEVGADPHVVEGDHEAYKEALKAEAERRAAKEPVLTQPEYVLSYQEQQDPEFHERLAKESKETQDRIEAEREVQNANYLAGHSG